MRCETQPTAVTNPERAEARKVGSPIEHQVFEFIALKGRHLLSQMSLGSKKMREGPAGRPAPAAP